jgi:hypothetical protein
MTKDFDKKTGYLKPGIHKFTLEKLMHHKILANTETRRHLIQNLKLACEFYWSYDIENIFIDGSFATEKPYPADIDGVICFEGFEDQRLEKILESQSVWGDFSPYDPSKPGDKFRMWYEYQIEFYIHPIHKPFKHNTFLEFFQHSRDDEPRGIIQVTK